MLSELAVCIYKVRQCRLTRVGSALLKALGISTCSLDIINRFQTSLSFQLEPLQSGAAPGLACAAASCAGGMALQMLPEHRPVIQRTLSPHHLSVIASYDVAGNTYLALSLPRHQKTFQTLIVHPTCYPCLLG